MTRVIGVDACKRGWVGVTSDLRGYICATIDQLVATADGDGELEVAAIDIPIGLPLTGTRQAGVLARGLVGKRKSSVFPTPIRSGLLATSHAEGSQRSGRHCQCRCRCGIAARANRRMDLVIVMAAEYGARSS